MGNLMTMSPKYSIKMTSLLDQVGREAQVPLAASKVGTVLRARRISGGDKWEGEREEDTMEALTREAHRLEADLEVSI